MADHGPRSKTRSKDLALSSLSERYLAGAGWPVFAIVCLSSLLSWSRCAEASAAEDLKLRAGISFTQDIDNGFPIIGSNMDDCKVATATPTFIFFGAAGDLNTNRQAKRVVYLTKKMVAHSLKFIIVDIDHPPNDDAKMLIRNYYHGYIPGEVLLDKGGKTLWSHDGEVEYASLKTQVDKSLE